MNCMMSDFESSNLAPDVVQSCAWFPHCDEASSIIICVFMQIRQKLIIFIGNKTKGFYLAFQTIGTQYIFSYPPKSLDRVYLLMIDKL